MILLTDEGNKPYHELKFCCICKKEFNTNHKNVKDHINFSGKYRGTAHSICNLKRNSSGCQLIIKNLEEEFKKEFKCLGENTEKHIT